MAGALLVQGEAGLKDASSRPHHSPRSIPEGVALAIVELRRKRLTQARIAQALSVSKATVSRVLGRAGLSRLSAIDPAEPVHRYEHQAPGDMLHIDIKKLARIKAIGHRVTNNPRDHVRGAGYECLFVAIDDHSRVAFTQMQPDETRNSAISFLQAAVTYFARCCAALGLSHRFTRYYRPQTNGKAERFIQSALREWAYGFIYRHSNERLNMLQHWTCHYNFHRPHQGIGGSVPASRINNVLQSHT